MNYRVLLGPPNSTVIDEHGNTVANSHVHEIKFPQMSIDTAHGRVWVIAGSATALISVDGTYYADAPCVTTPWL